MIWTVYADTWQSNTEDETASYRWEFGIFQHHSPNLIKTFNSNLKRK